jgi:hypothetical protein
MASRWDVDLFADSSTDEAYYVKLPDKGKSKGKSTETDSPSCVGKGGKGGKKSSGKGGKKGNNPPSQIFCTYENCNHSP